MQAMHGSAVTVRSRARMIACVMALALALSALVFAPAAANAEGPPPGGPIYMALGDSISFGYSARNSTKLPTERRRLRSRLVNFFNKKLKKRPATARP